MLSELAACSRAAERSKKLRAKKQQQQTTATTRRRSGGGGGGAAAALSLGLRRRKPNPVFSGRVQEKEGRGYTPAQRGAENVSTGGCGSKKEGPKAHERKERKKEKIIIIISRLYPTRVRAHVGTKHSV